MLVYMKLWIMYRLFLQTAAQKQSLLLCLDRLNQFSLSLPKLKLSVTSYAFLSLLLILSLTSESLTDSLHSHACLFLLEDWYYLSSRCLLMSYAQSHPYQLSYLYMYYSGQHSCHFCTIYSSVFLFRLPISLVYVWESKGCKLYFLIDATRRWIARQH